jgi:hypothetical protein
MGRARWWILAGLLGAATAGAQEPAADGGTEEEEALVQDGDGDGGGCDPEHTHPVFDASKPNLELQAGGGYSAFLLTWRQQDAFDVEGRFPDGAYLGPVLRAELAFGLGAINLAAVYTHVFAQHDGTGTRRDFQILSGEIGLQCTCVNRSYVWSFSGELGWDLNNDTLVGGIEHRSQFYVWQGLFLGFDIDVFLLYGLTTEGASGGGILGTLFLGYAIGG